MKHEADQVQGPLYAYLGHFKQRKFLEAGHNTVDDYSNPSDRMFKGAPPPPIQPLNPAAGDLFGGASASDAARGQSGSYTARNGRRYGQ